MIKSRVMQTERRKITYLRLSVTARCDQRCIYCRPSGHVRRSLDEGGKSASGTNELSPAEIERVARAAAAFGIRHIRITGGEPLLRSDVLEIISRLRAIDGLYEVSMTTNGISLSRKAAALVDAGLARINISLPAISAGRYCRIVGSDSLRAVLSGIAAARRAGLEPVKLNTVVLRGMNDDEIPEIVQLGIQEGVCVRFIEFMSPEGKGHPLFVPAEEILARVGNVVAVEPAGPSHCGPAKYYRTSSGARIGIIAPVSEPFCDLCNRLRLSSDGRLRACLIEPGEVDLGDLLRGGADTETLVSAFAEAARMKPERHCGRLHTLMAAIGG